MQNWMNLYENLNFDYFIVSVVIAILYNFIYHVIDANSWLINESKKLQENFNQFIINLK